MRAVYPGSFDPVTLGHLDIIGRSARIADELIVGVLHNIAKSPLFSLEERVRMLEEATEEYPNVRVEPFEGLLADFAGKVRADVLIRGLRAVTDFEYEMQMAQANYKLSGSVETMFLATRPEYAYLSASVVREVAAFGGDISQFVPETAMRSIQERMDTRRRV